MKHRVAIIDLPVTVAASDHPSTSSATALKVRDLLAAHPSLVQALIVEPPKEKGAAVPDGMSVSSRTTTNAASSSSPAAAPIMGYIKGEFGRLFEAIDNSTSAPLNLMGNPRQFPEKAPEAVQSLPWGAFRPSAPAVVGGGGGSSTMAMDAEQQQQLLLRPTTLTPPPQGAAGPSSSAVVASSNTGRLTHQPPVPIAGGVGVGSRSGNNVKGGTGTEALYMTQAAAVLYQPTYCTGLVVEVVTRRRKQCYGGGGSKAAGTRSAATTTVGEKRPREEEEEGSGEKDAATTTASAARTASTASKKAPNQQIIGYRIDSVVTRAATLGTPAEFCFALTAPEVGLRTAAFPPAAFFRHQQQVVHEITYRYDDDEEEAKAKSKPPPTIRGTWPPSRANPVPSQMQETHAAPWSRLTAAEKAGLMDLLEQCPIWDMTLLEQRLKEGGRCPRPHIAGNGVLCTTYTFLHGPFNRLRIRLGMDPTHDPMSRILQRLTIRLDAFTPIRLALKEVGSAPQCAQVVAMLREEGTKLPVAIIDGSVGPYDGPTAVKMLPAGQNPLYRVPRTELYCRLLEDRRGFWTVTPDQFLDDPAFMSIMNSRPLNRKCDAVTGWFHVEVFDRLQSYVKEDFHRWLMEEVAPRIAALAEGTAMPTSSGGGAANAAASAAAGGLSVGMLAANDKQQKATNSIAADDDDLDFDDLDDDDLDDLEGAVSDLGEGGSSVGGNVSDDDYGADMDGMGDGEDEDVTAAVLGM